MTDDSVDAMLERMAREEQDDIERKQGEAILAAFDAATKRRGGRDPILEALERAYQEREGGQE